MTEKMNIRTKMMHVQVELDAPKSQYNSFGNYAYRNAEDIKQALKPLQVQYNFYMEYNVDIVVKEGVRYVEVVSYFCDCDSDDKISSNGFAKEPVSKKGMSEEQVTGSASSYATKYALSNLFSIDDADDADNFPNGGVDSPNKQPQQAPQQPQRQPQKTAQQEVISSERYGKILKGIEKLSKLSGQEFGDVLAKVQGVAGVNDLKSTPKTKENACLSWLIDEIGKAEAQAGNNANMNLENM